MIPQSGSGQFYLPPNLRDQYHQQCSADKSAAKRKGRLPQAQPPSVKNAEIAYNQPLNKAAFCALPLSKYSKPSEQTKTQLAYMALADKKACESHAAGQRNRAETNRLVNTLQCPTRDKSINERVVIARFYAREWSGQHRVRIESFTRLQKAPCPVVGDRATEGLTESAARKITDSGAFVAATKGGFKTFLTLTLDSEARQRIQKLRPVPIVAGKKGDECGNTCASGDFYSLCFEDGYYSKIDWKTEGTIGREVSRFMDGLQKKYQRGWIWQESKPEKAANLIGLNALPEFMPPEYTGVQHSKYGAVPIARRLNYIWVAENPDRYETVNNPAGEAVRAWTGENPHVHVLLDWAVDRRHFLGWAEQIESLWGMGFAHLEKIKNPLAASHYLLKALGYMTKGAQQIDLNTGEIKNSQGRIFGNRYGISSDARAPDWECIGEFEAQSLAREIENVSIEVKAFRQKIGEKLEKLRDDEKKTKSEMAKTKNYQRIPLHVKERKIKALEQSFKRIEAVRTSLLNEKRSGIQAGKYQLTFMSKQQRDKFIETAILKAGWVAKIKESASVITKEVRQISDWASMQVKKTVSAIESVKTDFERYWQAILNDGEPLELMQ